MEGLAAKGSDGTETLVTWSEFLTSRAKVIWVTAADDSKAFVLFETLNDRGMDLAITDLLKNYLFSRASGNIDIVQEHWTGMTENLGDNDGEGLLLTFLRHYWLSKHGVTRTDRLYSSIKSRVRFPNEVVDLASQLYRNSIHYDRIHNPDLEGWSVYGLGAFGHMLTLNELGIMQIRPLLLAILADFPDSEVEKAMRFAVSSAVRLQIAGRAGTGSVEELYSKAAASVRSAAVRTSRALAAELRPGVPSDAEFRSLFETVSVPKPSFARYLLRSLEPVALGSHFPQTLPNSDVRAVNLEHILPKSPNKDWKIATDEAAALVNRLGNLAILGSGQNRRLQNMSFDEKRTVYHESPFTLTNEVTNQTSWGPEEIAKRQHRLAKLAPAAWPME